MSGARKTGWLVHAWLAAGLGFLYLPIAALLAGGLPASPSADAAIMAGFWLSLKVAALSACAALTLGALAAHALERHGCFKGRALLGVLTGVPLVMPQVIIGLAMLLMLASFGIADRGMGTVWAAHTLLGMAYATVLLRAGLRRVDPALHAAALDLGCRPLQAFFLVTAPGLARELAAAWLLAFFLSLNDVVLATFLSGGDTLSMVLLARLKQGPDPQVQAVAVLSIVTLAVLAACLYLARPRRP